METVRQVLQKWICTIPSARSLTGVYLTSRKNPCKRCSVHRKKKDHRLWFANPIPATTRSCTVRFLRNHIECTAAFLKKAKRLSCAEMRETSSNSTSNPWAPSSQLNRPIHAPARELHLAPPTQTAYAVCGCATTRPAVCRCRAMRARASDEHPKSPAVKTLP